MYFWWTLDYTNRSQHFRNAKVTGGGIWGFREGRFLAQGAEDYVVARGCGLLAFGGKAAEGGFDVRCVELVELFDVINDLGNLWSKGFQFFVGQIEMRELSDFRDVNFVYRHKDSGQ